MIATQTVNSAAPDLSGLVVVVVEDEPLLAMDVAMELEDAGALVFVAYDLEEAVRLSSNLAQVPNVAVLDVDLKGSEVFPAARLLRERDVPIVFHTGRGSPGTLLDEYPGSVVLSKPSMPDQIARTVALLVA